MRIKKAGILIIAAAITCTTPAVSVMAADTSESVQEIISDNEIDSLVSDPDKVVDIIMYVKNEAAKQDISDDQIRSLIQTAESTAGVSLSEEEENRIIKIVKQIKDSDIDEEQLRSAVTKAYDKLEEMGDIFEREGFAPVRRRWLDLALGLGSEATVRDIEGEQRGVVRDLDEEGHLLLDRAGESQPYRIVAGDLVFTS